MLKLELFSDQFLAPNLESFRVPKLARLEDFKALNFRAITFSRFKSFMGLKLFGLIGPKKYRLEQVVIFPADLVIFSAGNLEISQEIESKTLENISIFI